MLADGKHRMGFVPQIVRRCEDVRLSVSRDGHRKRLGRRKRFPKKIATAGKVLMTLTSLRRKLLAVENRLASGVRSSTAY